MATPRISIRMPTLPKIPQGATPEVKAYAEDVNRYLQNLQRELDAFTIRVDQLIKVAETLP